MKLTVMSVFVDDQAAALDFYTRVLGFVPAQDVDLGEYRWLTVAAPDGPDGMELLLEPAAHRAVAPFRAALVQDGIPFASFGVTDVEAEYQRMVALGVTFNQAPVAMGSVTVAVFDDTCGNLIQLAEQH